MSFLNKHRILVTGSRSTTDYASVYQTLRDYCTDKNLLPEDVEIMHGDCKGADKLAQAFADALGIDTIRVPARWIEHGRSAGFKRNAEMVAMGADVCVGFPLGDSKGTRMCLDIAAKAGIPTLTKEMSY